MKINLLVPLKINKYSLRFIHLFRRFSKIIYLNRNITIAYVKKIPDLCGIVYIIQFTFKYTYNMSNYKYTKYSLSRLIKEYGNDFQTIHNLSKIPMDRIKRAYNIMIKHELSK